MRTKNFLKHLIIGATFLTAGNVVGQSTTPGNVANLNTDFLGWNTNAANNFPLVVKHELNQPIQFRTDNVLRMRLMETLTGQTIGSYTNETLSGNLGLGVFGGTVARPFSMIHLNNGGTQFSGYRPWHRAGMTITQGSDLGWIGLKNEGGDLNHFTLAWADNTAVDGPDLLKFIFLANPGTTGTAGSLNGLEAMRIRPSANGLESFVGIGDWFTTGSNINPTERLDLLDGRLRIRQLPDDAEADAEYKVMVVDDSNDPNERGVVKWRSINLSAGCDWVVQDQFPFTPPHVSNTYDNSNCTWDRRHGVGIGVPIPKSKLYVYHWDNSLLSPTAITADARFDLTNAQQLFGLYSQARPSSSTTTIQNQRATGAFAQAFNSRSSVGVHGFGSTCTASSGTASEVIGVRGTATGCERAAFVAGLYGEGSGSQNGTNHWGAFINGPGYITQGPWQPSDEQLKTDIQPYGGGANSTEGAADVTASNPVLSLPVHRYQYNASAFPSLNLPAGEQVGFLAGELEALLPSAVKSVSQPAKLDSLGNEVAAAVDFKAINPLALLPYLVSAVQTQQAQIATLESQLAACCANPTVPADGKAAGSEQETLQGEPRSLLISPNPFNEATTLTYVLEREGRAQLLVNSADGKHLRSLFEGQRTSGEHRYEWSTADLTPGIYYVTLLFEGQPLVKKAVKVVR